MSKESCNSANKKKAAMDKIVEDYNALRLLFRRYEVLS